MFTKTQNGKSMFSNFIDRVGCQKKKKKKKKKRKEQTKKINKYRKYKIPLPGIDRK